MIFLKKLEKLVNMIKKYKILLIYIFLFNTESTAFSPEYEREMYLGCYSNSKQYLGTDRAEKYCLCTIEMLNKKFNDEQIKELFTNKPEVIMKKTEFASIHCEKNEKAF